MAWKKLIVHVIVYTKCSVAKAYYTLDAFYKNYSINMLFMYHINYKTKRDNFILKQPNVGSKVSDATYDQSTCSQE